MIEQAEAGIHTPVLSADEAPAASRRAIAGRPAVTGPATRPARPGRHRPHPRSSSGLPTPRPVSRRDGEHRTHRLSRPVLPRWPARPRPARSPGPPGRHRVPRRHKDARIQGGPRPLAASTQCAPSTAANPARSSCTTHRRCPIQTSPPAAARDICLRRRKLTAWDGGMTVGPVSAPDLATIRAESHDRIASPRHAFARECD